MRRNHAIVALCLFQSMLLSCAFVVTPTMGRLNMRSKLLFQPASHCRTSIAKPVLPMRMSMHPNAEKSNPYDVSKFMNKLKAITLTFLAVVALTLSTPLEALAGSKSGGRVGGGSFGRTTQSRKYSQPSSRYSAPAPSRTYGGGGTTVLEAPTVVIQRPLIGINPFFSPFGFGWGFSPFSMGPSMLLGGPSLGNVILAGGIAYVGYSVLTRSAQSNTRTNAAWGLPDWGGPELTVCKVQIATYCQDRGSSSVLGVISRLADEVDTEDPDSLASMVSDVALALLRKESDWISCKIESVKCSDEDDAEDKFSQFSLKERAKIERETVNRVRGTDKSDDRQKEGKLEDIGKPTAAIVTMILALEGRKVSEAKDAATLRKALSSIGSDVVGNDSLIAAELMWTPEEPWETVTPDEVILDYPDLIPL